MNEWVYVILVALVEALQQFIHPGIVAWLESLLAG